MPVLWTVTSSPTKGARPRGDHVSVPLPLLRLSTILSKYCKQMSETNPFFFQFFFLVSSEKETEEQGNIYNKPNCSFMFPIEEWTLFA